MKVNRCGSNPLIVPADVKPSRADFKVDGVFNCGVTKYNGEILLLCRVAESVKDIEEDKVKVPIVVKEGDEDKIQIITIIKSEHPEYDFSDSRTIGTQINGSSRTIYLTSLSHLRLAHSQDGIHFTVEESPFVFPNAEEESWGMEDPRITMIDGVYYINYSSVTGHGVTTSLITTRDFKTYSREGILFAPENKDVAIFPEKIGGKYVAFNRPVPSGIGNPDMWLAKSPDLIHWGEQQHFCGVSREDSWDNGRVGGGAVPIKTDLGWVKIYHAADRDSRYCLGVFLLDLENPAKVIAKLERPLLEPEEAYEHEGFFGNVVFTCGCLQEGDNIMIYYGAADDKICRADFSLTELMGELKYI